MMTSHDVRLIPLVPIFSLTALLAVGCAAPGQRGLQGKWQFRTTYGYESDLLEILIRTRPRSTINPAYLAVYPRTWVLLRTKRRYLARTFAAETRGTSTAGTVLLKDLQSGKRYAGRYARKGEWLHLHFVPGTTAPPTILRASKSKGAAYAALRWDGRAPTQRSPKRRSPKRHSARCPPSPTPRIAFDTPRATFDTLLLAFARNDASLLARCFAHPPDPQRAQKLLETAQKYLRRSCFIRFRLRSRSRSRLPSRLRPARRALDFWYRVTDPRDPKHSWEDRGRMRKVGPHWKIHKL